MLPNEKKKYLVILYYNYSKINDPQTFRDLHLVFCKKLGLLGRVIISYEGINGTLSGLHHNIYEYMENMKQKDAFMHMDFKIQSTYYHVFPKLSVKVKKEIVSLKLSQDIFPQQNKSNHLNPKEFYQFLKKDDVLVLDVRNNYEYDLGHFKNAINPKIQNFRDLPQWLEQNLFMFKNKKVLTYCTGGVRCEKVSVFLQEKGLKDVYQLQGGIVKYSQDEKVRGKFFEGKMYVFDQRIAVEVNQTKHVIIGKDFFDQTPCERYINCANPSCNKQILCSEQNEQKYLGSCGESCRKNPQNRYIKKNNNIIYLN